VIQILSNDLDRCKEENLDSCNELDVMRNSLYQGEHMLFNTRGCTYISEKDVMVFTELYKVREHFNEPIWRDVPSKT
jgi:hypothetical protein